MSKRKQRRKQRRSSRRLPSKSSEYRQGVRKADELLSRNDIEPKHDNWQQLALYWFAPEEPERGMLTNYITEYEDELGVSWAREILRLEVFFQAEDYMLIIEHYDQVFSLYPRCALVEMWVADQIFRHGGDFWRARQMYRYAMDHLPDHPKPYYELGFMSYLLGDFPGAVDWFSQAADRLADYDAELAARVFYNRGLVRYFLDDDKQPVIADMNEALRRKPDYTQAKEALRGLRSRRGRLRLVPW
jgi:tetratricopeptide (TPR) repeat protein